MSRGRLALSLDLERWLALLVAHPADRFLKAQARALGISLLSASGRIQSHGHVHSLW